jgi:hypothetical protein
MICAGSLLPAQIDKYVMRISMSKGLMGWLLPQEYKFTERYLLHCNWFYYLLILDSLDGIEFLGYDMLKAARRSWRSTWNSRRCRSCHMGIIVDMQSLSSTEDDMSMCVFT